MATTYKTKTIDGKEVLEITETSSEIQHVDKDVIVAEIARLQALLDKFP